MDKYPVTMAIIGAMGGVVLAFIIIITVLDILQDGSGV